ncbi:MAG: hypothetical protein HY903_13095 [Deltaproteobacteria bacterium]|nr:hypothetical protein [Deltaproteobacteria bacterium]
MMATDETRDPLALTPKVEEILSSVPESLLQAEVREVVILANAVLQALGRIHLPQDHFEEAEAGRPVDDKCVDLAPYVLSVVAGCNQLLAYIGETFEPPPTQAESENQDDFDLEFDLVDGPTGDGVGLTKQRPQERVLVPRDQVADALYAFGGMLRSRERDFAARLRYALAQTDRWPLLSELDDGVHKLEKAVQGLLFGVLGVFATEVRREEILPSYRSAIRESVALRAAVADLTYHIGRFNAAIADAAPGAVVPLIVAISDRLSRFAARPEYRTLRAEDKKAVIDFRSTLHSLRHDKKGVAMMPLKHAVEGFSKFLDAMSAINHREVLILHDRQRLAVWGERLRATKEGCVDDPEGALIALAVVISEMSAVQGRNPDLDQLRRDFNPSKIELENVGTEISRLMQLLDAALLSVG